MVVSWKRLWDGALDFGYKGTRCVQSIVRELSRPSFGDKLCCICGNGVESFLVHLCVGHPLLVCNESPTTIIDKLSSVDMPFTITLGSSLAHIT